MTPETGSESITAYEIDREAVKEMLVDSDDGDGSDGTESTGTLADHCRFDYQQSDTPIGPDDGEPDELTDDGEMVRDAEELVPPKRDPCSPVTRSQRCRAVQRLEGESDEQ